MTTILLAAMISDIPPAQDEPGSQWPWTSCEAIAVAASQETSPAWRSTPDSGRLSGKDLFGVTEMPEAVDTFDIADVANLADERAVDLAQPSLLGGPTVEEQRRKPITGEITFSQDPELAIREVHPEWSEDQVQEELLRIFVLRLLEFYDKAIEAHPELGVTIPIFPTKPPKLLRQLGRR